MLISGVRGAGKTVLLNEAEDAALTRDTGGSRKPVA